MNFNCPYCDKELNYMDLQASADLKAIIEMRGAFGRHGHVVMGYCYLFGVSPLHLKAKKLRLLLEELKRLFDAEAFTVEKRRYAISHAGIAEALDLMVKRNFTKHLSNHNYLKQIMIGIAEREAGEKSRQGERDLRKKESGLMTSSRCYVPEAWSGGHDVVVSPVNAAAGESVRLPRMKDVPPAHLTEEQIEANRRHLKKIMGDIG